MKFLLDQSAEARIGTFLRSQGHDATRVGKDHPSGLPDYHVLALAVSESRILITNDRDFGDLIFNKKHSHTGVIYFRFPVDTNAVKKIASLKKLFSTHAKDLGKFLVVIPRGIRIKT